MRELQPATRPHYIVRTGPLKRQRSEQLHLSLLLKILRCGSEAADSTDVIDSVLFAGQKDTHTHSDTHFI